MLQAGVFCAEKHGHDDLLTSSSAGSEGLQVDQEAAVLRQLTQPPSSLPQQAVTVTLECSGLARSAHRHHQCLHGTVGLLSQGLGTPVVELQEMPMTDMQLVGLTYSLLEAITFLQVRGPPAVSS